MVPIADAFVTSTDLFQCFLGISREDSRLTRSGAKELSSKLLETSRRAGMYCWTESALSVRRNKHEAVGQCLI